MQTENNRKNSASEIIRQTALSWSGVTAEPHRFGGIEFLLGTRELGHIHGNSLVDIPFPMKVRNELVESGRAEPHHILPKSGWVSFRIREGKDVDEAIELLRMSYEIAEKQKAEREQRANQGYEHKSPINNSL